MGTLMYRETDANLGVRWDCVGDADVRGDSEMNSDFRGVSKGGADAWGNLMGTLI